MSDESFTEWLREQRGERTCPPAIQAGLAAMVDAGQQEVVTDVVTEANASDRGGNHLIWSAIIEAAAKASPDEVGALDAVRALAWALLPTGVVTQKPHVVTPEAPPAPRGRLAGGDGAAAEAAAQIEAAAPAYAQTASKRQVNADLEAQGASRVSELVRLSCSMHMGRMASVEECAKATYGGHPGLSEGSRMMVKSKIAVLTAVIDLAKSGEGGAVRC